MQVEGINDGNSIDERKGKKNRNFGSIKNTKQIVVLKIVPLALGDVKRRKEEGVEDDESGG